MSGEPIVAAAQQADVAPSPQRHAELEWLARGALWCVILTAATKPAEVFGPGEQSWAATPPSDLAFRVLVLLACAFACCVALVLGRIRRSSLFLLPFLAWALLVVVAVQADFDTAKQVGSYATWILFYIAASALLDRSGDYATLVKVTVGAVVLSAACGELQYLLGYGPPLGSLWLDSAQMEFARRHTGAGGILLDGFTPCCAAMLLLSGPRPSLQRQLLAWLLVLWGTANVLRGGMLAFALGLVWYLWHIPPPERRRLTPLLGVGLVGAVLLFGGTIYSKAFGSSDGVNTSGRLDAWPLLAEWVAEAPILGHGPDADLELLALSPGGRDLRAAHNELLSTGVNYGIVGIALLWGPLLLLLAQSMRASPRAADPDRERLCAATAILLMIMVLSLTDNTLRTPGVMILSLAAAAVTGAGRSSGSAVETAPLELQPVEASS